jgi:hypothetical protein
MILPEANRIEAQEVRKQANSRIFYSTKKTCRELQYPVGYFIAQQLFSKGIKIPLILSNRNSDSQIRV